MQKLVGTELYVFDLTPFEITKQTADATVVYVQLECIDGYKELNPSLADIMQPFNQWLNCVKAPWKDGVEPPVTHTVTLSGTDLSGDVVTVKVNFETVEFANSYTVNDNEILEIFLSEDPSCYELASENMNYSTEGGPHYWINIASDLAVVLNYTEPSYNIVLSGTGVASDTTICGYENGNVTWVSGTYDSENNTVTIEYPAGQPFQIDERYLVIDSISPQLQESQDPLWGVGTSYVMPSANVAISLSSKYLVSFTSDSNAQAQVTINPGWAAENETIEITFNNGCTSQDVTVTSTDATLVYDSQNDKYTFTMPAQAVEIKAVYTNPVTVTLTEGSAFINEHRHMNPFPNNNVLIVGSGIPFTIWIDNEGGETQSDFYIGAHNATLAPNQDPNDLSWTVTATSNAYISINTTIPVVTILNGNGNQFMRGGAVGSSTSPIEIEDINSNCWTYFGVQGDLIRILKLEDYGHGYEYGQSSDYFIAVSNEVTLNPHTSPSDEYNEWVYYKYFTMPNTNVFITITPVQINSITISDPDNLRPYPDDPILNNFQIGIEDPMDSSNINWQRLDMVTYPISLGDQYMNGTAIIRIYDDVDTNIKLQETSQNRTSTLIDGDSGAYRTWISGLVLGTELSSDKNPGTLSFTIVPVNSTT